MSDAMISILSSEYKRLGEENQKLKEQLEALKEDAHHAIVKAMFGPPAEILAEAWVSTRSVKWMHEGGEDTRHINISSSASEHEIKTSDLVQVYLVKK